MSNTRHLRRALLTAAASAAMVGGLAIPAFAATDSGSPVSATVTVTQAVTLSLSSSTVAFGSMPPGGNTFSAAGITTTVQSNDAAGYTLTWAPTTAGENFGTNFPVIGNLTMEQGSTWGPAGVSTALSSPTTVSAPAGDVVNLTSFALQVPTSAAAGALSAPFTITVVAK